MEYDRETVYICSPYSGSAEQIAENVKVAQIACKVALDCGFAPIAPHLYLPAILMDKNPFERNIALEVCLKFVLACDRMWVIGTNITSGMDKEINCARYAGKKIHFIRLEEMVGDGK